MFSFRILGSDNTDLMKVQDNVSNVFATLSLMQILDGALVVNQTLAVGDNTISHGLGRQPLGWIPVDKTANTNLYRTSWDNRKLVLNSSAIATISLWIF